jgi:hypothetical protein
MLSFQHQLKHCHAQNLDLKNKMKARAAESEELSSTISHSVMRSFPLDSAGQLPKSQTLLRTIRGQPQAIPTDLDNKLPDHLKQTDRGENVALQEDKDLIIVTKDSNLSVLKTCKHWFDFYRMFTLHGLFKSSIVPLVNGLLIKKKTSDYDQFFN